MKDQAGWLVERSNSNSSCWTFVWLEVKSNTISQHTHPHCHDVHFHNQNFAGSEFWPYINNSVWVGGSQADPGGLNERVPYWLNGAVPLAVLSENQTLQVKVAEYIDFILSHQQSNGWLGPTDACCQFWPSFPLIMALISYSEYNKSDMRVIPAIVKFLEFMDTYLNTHPLDVWVPNQLPFFFFTSFFFNFERHNIVGKTFPSA